MSEEARIPGWYPDKETRGTRYWDGRSWTGDKRPQRKAFASVSTHRGWAIALIILGPLFVITSPGQFTAEQTDSTLSPLGGFFFSIFLGLVLTVLGVYLFRGQGPSTRAVRARIDQERQHQMQQHQMQLQMQQQSGGFVAAPAPQPVQVARDCTACSAPVSGLQGQIVTCSYCDSAQQL